jgi:hypothetical protein
MTNVADDLTVNSLLVTPSFSYAKRTGASLTIDAAALAELVGSADDARPLFVVLDGDATFSESATIPRRPFVRFYVTGTATVDAGVTLTVRGANHSATGSDLTAVDIRDITSADFDGIANPGVPAAGGAGGAAIVGAVGAGNAGSAGTAGGMGGGGSGAASGGTSGAGAAGSAYSGGPGGGGESGGATAVAGAARGGKGGDGAVGATGDRGAGSGAGNPFGAGASRGSGVGGGGADFTSGNFAIFAGTLAGSGTVASNGGKGGDATGFGRGGGGGGGGVAKAYVMINTFSGAFAANGGAAGTGNSANGGAGGLGSAGVHVDTLP